MPSVRHNLRKLVCLAQPRRRLRNNIHPPPFFQYKSDFRLATRPKHRLLLLGVYDADFARLAAAPEGLPDTAVARRYYDDELRLVRLNLWACLLL